jgi:hypothetical protein
LNALHPPDAVAASNMASPLRQRHQIRRDFRYGSLGRRGPQRLRGILPDHHLQTSDFEVRIVSRAPRKIVGSQIRFGARIDGIWCGGERAMGQPGFFDLDRRLEAINAKGDA